MNQNSRSLPLAFVLAAAAMHAPGTILPDVAGTGGTLQPGVLSPLMETATGGGAAIGGNGDRPSSHQRTAQRFLNFLNR